MHEELQHLLMSWRKRRGLSQDALGQLLGWSQRTISNIESGEKRVTVVELIEIAAALDFDPAAAVRRVAKQHVGAK